MIKRILLLFVLLLAFSLFTLPFYIIILLNIMPEYLVDRFALSTYAIIWVIAYIINYIDWRRNK